MSSFELTGTVTKFENLTSSKGNAYMTFQIVDSGKTFELSLFGDTMGFSDKITSKKPIVIKGVLGTREYTDKNGKVRFNTELKPSWIEFAKVEKIDSALNRQSDPDCIADLPF